MQKYAKNSHGSFSRKLQNNMEKLTTYEAKFWSPWGTSGSVEVEGVDAEVSTVEDDFVLPVGSSTCAYFSLRKDMKKKKFANILIFPYEKLKKNWICQHLNSVLA